MEIVVNGKKMECDENTTIDGLIENLGYKKERIACEVNGDIVIKSEYENFILSPSDTLEIVTFVGGG